MNDEKTPLEDFFDFADWEGGLLEYIIDYDVNPEDTPLEVRPLVEEIQHNYRNFIEPALSQLERLHPQYRTK